MHQDKDHPVKAHPEKCVGCRSCQLRCSFVNLEEFNPLKSHIVIVRSKGMWTTDIQFTDDCILCSECADFCSYGALTTE